MVGTGSLLILQLILAASIFMVAAICAMLVVRIALKYKKDKEAAEKDDSIAAPKLPAVALMTYTVLVGIFVMLGLNVHIWMPKADTSAPTVNSTIQSQMHRDADRPVEVVPVPGPKADFDAQAAERQKKIDEARKQFESLPDDG